MILGTFYLDHKFYIQKRILILTDSNRTFRTISHILFVSGLLLIVVPFLVLTSQDISIKFAELGFGVIMVLVPVYLSSESAKRKIQILELKHLLIAIEKFPNIKLEDDAVLKKILEKL